MKNDIKNFPAPKSDPGFVKYWDKYLPKVIGRENFHEAHLDQLEILCDSYIEYHNLTEFIKENGYSYSSDGRYGESHREYREVVIRKNMKDDIRHYSKLLGLVLEKDQDKNDKDKKKSEWD